jgi:hypothetical protein
MAGNDERLAGPLRSKHEGYSVGRNELPVLDEMGFR